MAYLDKSETISQTCHPQSLTERFPRPQSCVAVAFKSRLHLFTIPCILNAGDMGIILELSVSWISLLSQKPEPAQRVFLDIFHFWFEPHLSIVLMWTYDGYSGAASSCFAPQRQQGGAVLSNLSLDSRWPLRSHSHSWELSSLLGER